MKGSRGRSVDNAVTLKEILDAESLHVQRKRVRFEASFLTFFQECESQCSVNSLIGFFLLIK